MKYKINLFLLFCLLTSFSFAQNKAEEFTLNDIVKGKFYAKSVYGLMSMNNGVNYTTLNNRKSIVEYSYKTGDKVKTIFNLDNFKSLKIKAIDDYSFNSDETQILLVTQKEQIYRHSFKAVYYIFNIKNQTIERLSEGKQQLATFSPTENKVAFFYKNNLFIKNIDTGKIKQITFDGKHNCIINGAPDWVYEEEFSFAKGFHWSSDGKYIAYYRFDETNLKEYNITLFQGSHPALTENKLYPANYSIKYPKAGEDNSIVSIHIFDEKNNTTKTVDIGKNTDQYIPRILWTANPNQLAVVRLNRLQNKYELLFADAETGKSKVIYTEINKCYVEINDDLTFLKDKKHFILTSEKNGFNHIYLYDINGKLVRQITKGNFDVTHYYGYNSKTKTIYYQAAKSSPLQREIFSIGLNGKNNIKLSKKEGTNNAVFSKGFKYYINYFSDINTPTIVSLHNEKGKTIRILENNSELKKLVKNYKMPKKEFFSFKNSEGISLNAWILKPYNFDSTKTYPALLYVYGGPGVQTVLNRWEFQWFNYLTEKGYIVFSVDNRGTGARGEKFKKCTYMQLQNLEFLDLIDAKKYMGNKKFIDSSRIGIYGWSFGGQMSSLCMLRGAGNFKAGIAVAPVTTYRYYDNIYSERYLRTPQENPKGYDNYAAINYADKLKGKFLLIHGTSDDNVHIQNTLELSEKLVQNNKQFEMQLYTNRNHGIYGGNTRLHLYTRMSLFLIKNL